MDTTTEQKIIEALRRCSDRTQRELAEEIFGPGGYQQRVNQNVRKLVATGVLIENSHSTPATYKLNNKQEGVSCAEIPTTVRQTVGGSNDDLHEDAIKKIIQSKLTDRGFEVVVAFGRQRGIDIVAKRNGVRKVIEVKGCGSRQQMRVNYFLAILGETLQRMNDPQSEYWIALPNLPQYRGLWDRLPDLAKSRTGIRAMLVDADGTILELD